ncbi:MAG: type II secretion system minor pseudopilin GspK [Burkholderiaceae bacterium]
MKRQKGAALLAAMLTVTLVATMAAAALWQQWRSVEVEAAERSRVQSTWLLTGALDWARLILREDARSGGADHLAEPWAVPLQEARLATFLSMDVSNADADRDAFLSGQVSDLQARLNVMNLIDQDKISVPGKLAFDRLFEQLGLPPEQVNVLADQLLAAKKGARSDGTGNPQAPLLPQRIEQLVWLGLPAASLSALKPYITLLPERTQINLNTASAEVLQASVTGLDPAEAKRLVAARETAHFSTIADAGQRSAAVREASSSGQLSVNSRFFEVRGRIRLDQAVVEERSVVQRDGLNVRTLWRDHDTTPAPAAPPPG